ncbi:hypothetical protein EV421DRAFT_1740604 [Armillaria borealis]|uniref:Uncharacterized protein n=1 Tax=Armillaria borealis TaxID=47425 RepID=A0AA39MHE6_9AGAR|nr:hypothetical protein EV421DRAFT_1740604 [Armillaria borealis]
MTLKLTLALICQGVLNFELTENHTMTKGRCQLSFEVVERSIAHGGATSLGLGLVCLPFTENLLDMKQKKLVSFFWFGQLDSRNLVVSEEANNDFQYTKGPSDDNLSHKGVPLVVFEMWSSHMALTSLGSILSQIAQYAEVNPLSDPKEKWRRHKPPSESFRTCLETDESVNQDIIPIEVNS